eukprot:620075-Pleurochrysis_carterae.AAC.2
MLSRACAQASARAAEAQNRRAVAEYNLAQANAKKERERAQQISEMQCNVEARLTPHMQSQCSLA